MKMRHLKIFFAFCMLAILFSNTEASDAALTTEEEVEYDCRQEIGVICNKKGSCHSNGVCICKPDFYGPKCEQSFNNRKTMGGMTVFLIVIAWILIPFCCLGCVVKLHNYINGYRYRPRAKTITQKVHPQPKRQKVRQDEPTRSFVPKPSQPVQAQPRQPVQEFIADLDVDSNHFLTYKQHKNLISCAIIFQARNGEAELGNMAFLSAEGCNIHHWNSKGQKESEINCTSKPTKLSFLDSEVERVKYLLTGHQDGTVQIYQITLKDTGGAEYKIKHSFKVRGYINVLTGFLYSNTPYSAVSGDKEKGLKIYKYKQDAIEQFKTIGNGIVSHCDVFFRDIHKLENYQIVLAYYSNEIAVYEFPSGSYLVKFQSGLTPKSVQFDPDTQLVIAAGDKLVKFFAAGDFLKGIGVGVVNCMKVLYCWRRHKTFIIVSAGKLYSMQTLSIFDSGASHNIPIKTYNLEKNFYTTSIDGFYDQKLQKIIFMTTDNNNHGQCKVYQY